MSSAEQRVCDVVTACPGAVSILENLGVDYWFNWNRQLRSACEAANVNPERVAADLATLPPSPAPLTLPVSLAGLLEESNRQANEELLPEIDRAKSAASRVVGQGAGTIQRLLESTGKLVRSHQHAATQLLLHAPAIDSNAPAVVDPELLRRLRLDPLELARLAKELTTAVHQLSDSPQTLPVTEHAQRLVHGIHRHITVAYNFILPRLVTAWKQSNRVGEPW
jgi:Regulator of cell morphogenesis and NO signaling